MVIEPEDEDYFEVDSEPYFFDEEEDAENTEEKDDLLRINKWIFLYNLDNKAKKFTCNIVLPNPAILGLEKTYEICEFLIGELNALLKISDYVQTNKTVYKALLNCLFIIDDMIHNRLKM